MNEQQYTRLVGQIDRDSIAIKTAEGPILSNTYRVYMTSVLDAMYQDEVDYEEANSKLVALSGELVSNFYSTK